MHYRAQLGFSRLLTIPVKSTDEFPQDGSELCTHVRLLYSRVGAVGNPLLFSIVLFLITDNFHYEQVAPV